MAWRICWYFVSSFLQIHFSSNKIKKKRNQRKKDVDLLLEISLIGYRCSAFTLELCVKNFRKKVEGCSNAKAPFTWAARSGTPVTLSGRPVRTLHCPLWSGGCQWTHVHWHPPPSNPILSAKKLFLFSIRPVNPIGLKWTSDCLIEERGTVSVSALHNRSPAEQADST